jgi:hypothetical protein
MDTQFLCSLVADHGAICQTSLASRTINVKRMVETEPDKLYHPSQRRQRSTSRWAVVSIMLRNAASLIAGPATDCRGKRFRSDFKSFKLLQAGSRGSFDPQDITTTLHLRKS